MKLFLLLPLAGIQILQLKRYLPQHNVHPLVTIVSAIEPSLSFVVATWSKRYQALKLFLNKYGMSPWRELKAMYIVWNDQNRTAAPPYEEFRAQVRPDLPLYLTVVNETIFTMDCRFCSFSNISSEYVLVIDDDVNISVEALNATLWMMHRNASYRNNLVGYHPRTLRNVQGKIEYIARTAPRYSMALTGTAFVRTKWFLGYCKNAPAAARQVTRDIWRCEDIAFNYYFRFVVGGRPVLVKCRVPMRKEPGAISAAPEHGRERGECSRRLAKVYGNYIHMLGEFEDFERCPI